MPQSDTDIIILEQCISQYTGLSVDGLKFEKESQEYNACRFTLNTSTIICRTAKITPTKTGQFVTIWNRNRNGIIQPFHISDNFDFVIIIVKRETQFGHFIFPKEVLVQKGIVSTNQKEGKRGIRIYPIWDSPTSKQARKTQYWQLDYFTSAMAGQADIEKLKALYSKI